MFILHGSVRNEPVNVTCGTVFTTWSLHNPESIQENETQISQEFCDTNGSPNIGQTTRPSNKQKKKIKKKKKENLLNSGLCRHGRPQIERKLKDKYIHMARERRKLRKIKLTVIPIVTGALGTISEGLVKQIEDLAIR